MDRIQFNTGRHYTAHGQRIVAQRHADDVVTFYDHDRGIAGEFDLHCAPFDRATVMAIYDAGSYRMSARAIRCHALDD